jgi:hypothetical protein
VELDEECYNLAVNAIPLLANLYREVNTTQPADAVVQQTLTLPDTTQLAPFLQERLF